MDIVTPKRVITELLQNKDDIKELVTLTSVFEEGEEFPRIEVNYSNVTNERLLFMSEILKQIAMEM